MSSRVSPTTDLDKARHDLDVVGYCIVEGVAPDDLVSQARERILEQASAERDAGERSYKTAIPNGLQTSSTKAPSSWSY